MSLKITEDNKRWFVLVTMTGALSMILIDQTVVSVALPTIQRDLDMSQTSLQWIVNAYLLAMAALVALGGRLGEIHGLSRLFRLGALVFVIASASCGLAVDDVMILISRTIQGAGAAMMLPATAAIVANAFGADERGRAMGIYAGISMVFLALGPLIGGLLTEYVTWRAVFWVNVPVGAAMLVLAHRTVPRDAGEPGAKLDTPGAVTLVLGLVCLVLPLMQSQKWGWGDPKTITLLALSVVLLLAFVVIERRSKYPLIDLHLLAVPNFGTDMAVLGATQFALMGLTVFGALWTQNVLGFSPIEAGLALLPVTLPLLVVAPRAGAIYDRIGPRYLTFGGALLGGLSLLWIAYFLSEQSYGILVPGYIGLGLGIALIMTPATADALNVSPAAERGQASGVMQTFRQVGATMGVAIMGTVVANVESDKAATGPLDSFTSAVGSAYYVGAGVMIAGAIAALLFLRRREATDAPPEGGAAAALG